MFVHLGVDLRLAGSVAIICGGGGGVGVAETNGSQEYILKSEEHKDIAGLVGHKDLQLNFHNKAPGPSYLAMTSSVLISISLAGQHPN